MLKFRSSKNPIHGYDQFFFSIFYLFQIRTLFFWVKVTILTILFCLAWNKNGKSLRKNGLFLIQSVKLQVFNKARSLFNDFIGLMKIEAKISKGAFLALSPKCYWLGDEKAEKRFILTKFSNFNIFLGV